MPPPPLASGRKHTRLPRSQGAPDLTESLTQVLWENWAGREAGCKKQAQSPSSLPFNKRFGFIIFVCNIFLLKIELSACSETVYLEMKG